VVDGEKTGADSRDEGKHTRLCDVNTDSLYVSIAGGKNKDKDGGQRPATAAVAKTTPSSKKSSQAAPPDNINDWTTGDVKNWLDNNSLKHLRSWYDIESRKL